MENFSVQSLYWTWFEKILLQRTENFGTKINSPIFVAIFLLDDFAMASFYMTNFWIFLPISIRNLDRLFFRRKHGSIRWENLLPKILVKNRQKCRGKNMVNMFGKLSRKLVLVPKFQLSTQRRFWRNGFWWLKELFLDAKQSYLQKLSWNVELLYWST